jgi:hypothetical protein
MRTLAFAIALSLASPSAFGLPKHDGDQFKQFKAQAEKTPKKILAELETKGQRISLLEDRVEFRIKERKSHVKLDGNAVGGAILENGKKALAVLSDGSIELLRFTENDGVRSGRFKIVKGAEARITRALAGGYRERCYFVFPERREYYLVIRKEGKKWDVREPIPMNTAIPQGAHMECGNDGCSIMDGNQPITKIR